MFFFGHLPKVGLTENMFLSFPQNSDNFRWNDLYFAGPGLYALFVLGCPWKLVTS